MRNEEKHASDDGREEGSSQGTVAITVPKVEDSMGITEESPHVHNWKRQNLFLDIPSRPSDEPSQDFVAIRMPPTPSPTPRKVNFSLAHGSTDARTNGSPGPSSSRSGKSSIRGLFPKLSFKHRSSSEVDKADNSASEGSTTGPREKPMISRSLSLTKLFTPRMKRTSSLPVTPILHSNPESTHGGSVDGTINPVKKEVQTRQISRSLSVPVINNKEKTMRRMDSFFRVIPSTPRAKEGDVISIASPKVDAENDNDDGEDIREDEAVCRICLVELCEGGETLKMECSCKGELALAHQECAVKWFSIKGNKTCDICKQEVRNLSVTLLRIQSIRTRNSGLSRSQLADPNGYRQVSIGNAKVWQEVPVLVIVSMLAYFCFLEQLLVGKMSTGAIAISLPFSCVLGLLSSMTSSTMDILKLCGEEKICLGLCIYSICSGGSLCTYILLLDSRTSSIVYSSGNICWAWCCHEWKFNNCGVLEMEKKMAGFIRAAPKFTSNDMTMPNPWNCKFRWDMPAFQSPHGVLEGV
ncbi:hypothetical protein FEM48_Zijuj02G0093300 [Ziziphus jujuba var. spinosa]|uniref:RING-CH-type domain-containing protein n=1 Tax=Ziziphus jujuba var. spinosa TaxID=714518 RepID=A0A978VUX5_ZIZJJ|nr:hypothetical protein FEM48_Zijuj02G0093300 [Ziziphus jujuba var. spinosa]